VPAPPWDQIRPRHDQNDPRYYEALQWLAAQGIVWNEDLQRWMAAVEDVGRSVWDHVLCSDLVALIQSYA